MAKVKQIEMFRPCSRQYRDHLRRYLTLVWNEEKNAFDEIDESTGEVLRTTPHGNLDLLGREIPDPTRAFIAVETLNIQQKMAEFTRLADQQRAIYDDLHEDDWNDHLEDLPEEGLSPHEDPSAYLLPTPDKPLKNKDKKEPDEGGKHIKQAESGDSSDKSDE
jgi:hypothetical protein